MSGVLFYLKFSKEVDRCFSMSPEIYELEKIDEDNEYNYFKGTRSEHTKLQKILILVNCYEVYNKFENIVQIDTDIKDPKGEKTVIFMVNTDERFQGTMVVLNEDFENTIIFMENLSTALPEQKKKLENLNFDKNLKNFYRALRFPSDLLTESSLKKEVKIIAYENSTVETINF